MSDCCVQKVLMSTFLLSAFVTPAYSPITVANLLNGIDFQFCFHNVSI